MSKLLIIVLLIFPYAGAYSQANDASEVFENCIDKVGLITDGGGRFGSGFFVNSNTFVTNYHVVDNLWRNYIYIKVKSGDEYPADVIATDSKRDLAILKIRGSVNYLRLAKPEDIKQGDKVYALGNTGTADFKLFDFNITEGIISNIKFDKFQGKDLKIQAKVILHSATINSGNSGGPLVTSNGAVAGVNSFYYTIGNNLYFAIHVSELIDFLNENNVKYYTESKTEKISDSTLFKPFIIIGGLSGVLIIGLIVFLFLNKRNKGSLIPQKYQNLQERPKFPISQQNQYYQPNNQFPQYDKFVMGNAYLMYKGRKQPIDKNFYVVGRDKSCNLVLDDITASRQHFAIIRQNDNYVLKDLNSKNGTFLNGIKIQSSALKNSDIIKIGSTTLIFSK